MKLEIVSHCWRYARLLNYQLSSLVLFPPRNTHVTMTVVLTCEDPETVRVVEYFATKCSGSLVTVRPWILDRQQLMRREIGRNQVALATEADWVWFTDCDHCFGKDALDSIETAAEGVNDVLIFPRHVLTHESHALGDAAIENLVSIPEIAGLKEHEFSPKLNRRAIGGVQIARGAVVRELGYLKDSKLQHWYAETWQRCIGDTWFRRKLESRGTPVDIPNVFRIRHSKIGRADVDVRL